MADDEEWKKLPTISKVQHSQWKARVEGYTEANKLFASQTSENAPVFNEYVGLMKKFVTDANAVAQETALDAVLVFLENAAAVSKCASDIASGLVTKCLSSARAKTKDKAIECLLEMVEIEKQDVACEELLKGLSNKNPKVVVGCLQTLRETLNLFGPTVIPMKQLLKEYPRLFDDRDKNVRAETKNLVVEIYRWIGHVNKNLLNDVKPVMVAELTATFNELPKEKPVPTRYLRSQRPKEEPVSSSDATGAQGTTGAGDDETEVDLESCMDPVEILSKVPKDFYTLIVDKKWKERQSALEGLEKVTNVPLIAQGDFGELTKTLINVVSKDPNIVLATMATKILGELATGLRKNYVPYAQPTIAACLGKFKEKKPTAVAALRETVDAAAKYVNLDVYIEDVVEALGQKAPGVRAETALFLSRCFARCKPGTLTKKNLKALTVPLCATCGDTVPEVRENSFAALGAAMRLVTPKVLEPLLTDLDPIRMGRIKEHYEQGPADKADGESGGNRPVTAPPVANAAAKPRRGAPPAQRPGTAVSKDVPADEGDQPSTKSSGPPGPKKKAGAASGTKSSAAPGAKSNVITENLMSDEVLEQKAYEIFTEELITKQSVSEWKERLAAATELQEKIKAMPSVDSSTQLLCRILMRKPGLKDSNIQVLKIRFETFQYVLESSKSVSSNLAEIVVPELMEKLGDVKVGETVKNCLTLLSERCSFEFVGGQVLQSTFKIKNPRAQADALNWLSKAIEDFGLKIRPPDLVSTLRTGLNATNPAVRQASLSLAGVAYLYMGDALRNLLADEKPAVVSLLNSEFEKNADKKPPAPTRGPKPKTVSQQKTSEPDSAGDNAEAVVEEEPDSEAFLPRVDISGKLTPELLTLLSSKAWKERQEALNSIQQIIESAKYIEGSNGALQGPLTALAKACGDVNKNLGKAALNIMALFGKALPKADATGYLRCVEPAILQSFTDSKPQFREAALSALTAWQSRVPFIAMTENDMLADALKTENAFLRADLLKWLAGALVDVPANSQRSFPPDFTQNIMPHVFSALEDRSPDARKQAQLVLPQLIRVLGWEGVSKAANKLKPVSKDTVLPQLEKARESVKASSPEKSPSGGNQAKAIRGGGTTVPVENEKDENEDTSSSPSAGPGIRGGKKKAKGDKKKQPNAPPSASSSPSKESTVSLPLQPNKNAKHARLQDEKKRKLLKWDFDAPSRDHIQQLNQLFVASGASPDLVAMLFHTDFKQHVKAIGQLSQLLDTPEGEDATYVNIDLILRWVTLRYFDTNPVVTGRCMDYVTKLFSRMSESAMSLTEHDGAAFLPYLVLKAGDSKDTVRQSVRGIFRLVANIYAPSRLFTFLSNGIKSKTNKTRQECLDEMGSLIDRFGVSVCQPSMPVALKAIAQQIGDRDSGVRSAALNALVNAYAIIGEQLWKVIGNLSDKDRTMLEERIKRAGRLPNSSSGETSEIRPPPVSAGPARREASENRRAIESARYSAERITPAQARARALLSELGDLSPEKAPNMPNLISLDAEVKDLFKPFEIPALKTHARTPVLTALLRTSPDTASAITMVVTAISSNDLLISCHALAELDTVLLDEKWYLLLNHVNQILMLITMQLKQVTTIYYGDPSIPEDQLRTLIRCHLATIESLFKRPTLGREASRETLRELLQTLLQLMLDERTMEMPDGENVIRVINALFVRIIDAANGTRVLSGLIRLLHESVSEGHFTNRITQAIMKSLWRITKKMDTTVNNYSLEIILADCHNFLRAFPSSSWKSRKSDVPLRTIKTMLHTLCRLEGYSVLDFLNNIPNKDESEMEEYLLRTLKTIGSVPNQGAHTRRASGNDGRSKPVLPSAGTREKLTEIFRKVGSKQPEEGLNELYDFTQMYPDVDLSSFLTKTSQFFQTYIRQALKNIAVERARQGRPGTGSMGDVNRLRSSLQTPLNGLHDSGNFTGSMDLNTGDGRLPNPKVFMDRLALLRRELGLGGVSTTNVDEGSGLLGSTQVDGDEENPRNPAVENALRNMVHPASSENIPGSEDQVNQRPTMTATELMDIRRRLECIKRGQQT
ncbi:unnamed protein product [Calicophoron daubneyi]|uniref:TOG domain-containing protein n=1 Tax=Calicophoron daubneyi TaxID=300641 RepID=A0AAV2TYH1_CALDB